MESEQVKLKWPEDDAVALITAPLQAAPPMHEMTQFPAMGQVIFRLRHAFGAVQDTKQSSFGRQTISGSHCSGSEQSI